MVARWKLDLKAGFIVASQRYFGKVQGVKMVSDEKVKCVWEEQSRKENSYRRAIQVNVKILLYLHFIQ